MNVTQLASDIVRRLSQPDPEIGANKEILVAGMILAAMEPQQFPDIGLDPLQFREATGGTPESIGRLRHALVLQQKLVPDQTALVWRIDIDRALCELTVMTARWENRVNKP